MFVISQAGKQKAIAYFATHIEAEIFQADFYKEHTHRSLPGRKITVAELYHRWLPQRIAEYQPSASTIASYKNAYKHLQAVWDTPITELKYYPCQQIIDRMKKNGLSYSSCKKVRSLLSLLFQYGIKLELISKNYAPLLHLGRNKSVRPHKVFTRQKINRLWNIAEQPNVDTVLILLYTGMRCGELLALQKSDINLAHRTISITHSKTISGIRTIPIHPRILPFITARLETAGTYLIADHSGQPYSYSRYRTIWDSIMHQIHADGHTTHDCRHTVATLLDNAGANETAKRRILGHASSDVTERVYTHKGLRQLRKTIELLK